MSRRRFRYVLVPLLLLAGPALGAGDDPAEKRRTIAVTGRGEVKAPPDRAGVSFAVETTADRAAEAAAENAKRSAAVAAALRSVAGADAKVTTTRYTLEPRYDMPRPGETREPRITGYLARNQVQVDDLAVDKTGSLLDAATAAGANRVEGLRFSLSRQGEMQREALEKAGADARLQAESAARGLGVRLKGVISAATTSFAVPVAPRMLASAMAAESHAAPTPIEPGESTVTATLQVTYEIEPLP